MSDTLLQQAVQIRDEKQDSANTAVRVGRLFVDIITRMTEEVTTDRIANGAITLDKLATEVHDILAGGGGGGEGGDSPIYIPQGYIKEYMLDAGIVSEEKLDPAVLDRFIDIEEGIGIVSESVITLEESLGSLAYLSTISTSNLADKAVTDDKLADAVVNRFIDIEEGIGIVSESVITLEESLGSLAYLSTISTSNLADKAVTDDKLADAVVNRFIDIEEGIGIVSESVITLEESLGSLAYKSTITQDDIDASAVTTSKIKDGAITSDKLSDAIKQQLGWIPSTTDDLPEGSASLYFTEDRARAAVDGLYLPIGGTAKSAETAGTAASAGYANSAGQATNDSAGNKIVDTYLKISDYNESIEGFATESWVGQNYVGNGTLALYLKKESVYSVDISPTVITPSGSANSKYYRVQKIADESLVVDVPWTDTVYTDAMAQAAVDGLYLPIGGTAKTAESAGTAASAGYANSAGQATNDSAGNKIVDTYLKISDYNESIEGFATESWVGQNYVGNGTLALYLKKESVYSVDISPTVITPSGSANSKYYRVQKIADESLVVDVPWTDTVYTDAMAQAAVDGLYLPIGGTAKTAESAGTAASAGYANSAGQATNDSAGNKIVDTYLKISDYNESIEGFATESWVGQNYASAGTLALYLKKESVYSVDISPTVITPSGSANSKYYRVQKIADESLVVDVPWTDTVYTDAMAQAAVDGLYLPIGGTAKSAETAGTAASAGYADRAEQATNDSAGNKIVDTYLKISDYNTSLEGLATEDWVGQNYVGNGTLALYLKKESVYSVNISPTVITPSGSANSKYYRVQKIADESLVVDVPWTDTVYTDAMAQAAVDGLYLPLIGGTVDGSLEISYSLGTMRFEDGAISVDNSGTTSWSVDDNGNGSFKSLTADGNSVIHSGNIGSQSVAKANVLARHGTITADTIDSFLDTSGVKMCSLSSYAAAGWGNSDGMIISIPWNNLSYGAQIAIDDQSNYVAMRAKNSGTWLDWRPFAFLDSTVAAANKLSTPRTIWGQSFDGSGDVSGNLDMGAAGDIVNAAGGICLHVTNEINCFKGNLYLNHRGDGSLPGYTSTAHVIICANFGNVGIGTAAPEYKLDVKGGARVSGDLFVNGAQFSVGSDGNLSISKKINGYLSTSGGTITGNLTVDGILGLTDYLIMRSHYLFVRDNDNADWVVTDKKWQHEYNIIHSGNIGSQSVSYATNAESATKLATSRTIWGNGFDGTDNITGSIYLPNDSDLITNSGSTGITIDESSIFWHNESNYKDTNVPTLLKFTSSGYVGVGTDEPEYKLDVKGDARVDDDLFVNGTIITPGNDSVVIKPAKNNYDQIGGEGIAFWKIFATNFYGAFHGNAETATKLATSHTIWGQSFDGTGDVAGAPSFPSFVDINRNADTGVLLNSSKLGFEIETYANDVRLKTYTESGGSNTSHLVLTGSGNVGIGTTNPNTKLHVAGDAKIDGALSTSGGDLTIETTNSDIAITHYKGTTKLWTLRNYNGCANFSDALYVQSGSTPVRVATESDLSSYLPKSGGTIDGKLFAIAGGSGASSISYANAALTIGTVNRATAIGSYFPGLAFNHMYTYNSGSTYRNHAHGWIGLRLHSTPTAELSYLIFATNGSSVTGSNLTERMCIAPSGEVGIGTTAPEYTLEVNGDAKVSNLIVGGYTLGGSSSGFTITISGTTYDLLSTFNGYTKTNADNTFIKKTGGTGLGTLEFGTTPNAHIAGCSSTSQLIFRTSINATSSLLFEQEGSNGYVIRSDDEAAYWSLGDSLNRFNTVYCRSVSESSDATKKNIIGNIELTASQIANAPAVHFTWKDDGTKSVGTIAQYWKDILPEVVSGDEGSMGMNYAVLGVVSSIILARNIETHEQKIQRLEKEISDLRKELETVVKKQ